LTPSFFLILCQVPDYCCSEESTAFEWFPFETTFVPNDGDPLSVETDGKCILSHPFGPEAGISPVLVSGCAADGTQFYGEKCGGSDFSGLPVYDPWTEAFGYGTCGPVETHDCDCFTYVETKEPGCYVIAAPNPAVNVLLQHEGCCVPCDEGRKNNRKLLFGRVSGDPPCCE
jgi:hypothetical protein